MRTIASFAESVRVTHPKAAAFAARITEAVSAGSLSTIAATSAGPASSSESNAKASACAADSTGRSIVTVMAATASETN